MEPIFSLLGFSWINKSTLQIYVIEKEKLWQGDE